MGQVKRQDELVKELFSYLDYIEYDRADMPWHPVHISCCRAMMMNDIEKCLKALRETICT